MTKILVIPDVHLRPFWKNAVSLHKDEVDKIVFLGDEVDPYPDEGFTRKQAIQTLLDIIEYKKENKDKVILLIGNHAAHYYLNGFPRASRYDSSNAYKIREIYLTNKNLFELAHEEIINGKKYLFTHAGLMNSWLERNKNIIGEPTVENLNSLINHKKGIRALAEISKYRTWFGEDSGSILWSDVREKIDEDKSEIGHVVANEDSIVEGYDYQIFGHTQLEEDPIITDKWACLDCRKAFILNEDGTLTQIENERVGN